MSSSNEQIIIVGGGIAGAAASLALALKGYPSVVLEQATEFSELGAGLQFGPNALKALRRIGFTNELDELAIYPESAVMRDSVTDELVVQIPFGEAFVRRFKAPYALIHRHDLLTKLLDAASRTGKVTLTTNAKVVAFAQDGRGVTATTEDGRTFEGRALIGADGLWSVVRQKIVGDGQPRVAGHVTYRAVLSIEETPPDLRDNVMKLFAGDKVHAVFYPVRGGKLFNLAGTFHSKKHSTGWDDFGDTQELRDSFAEKSPKLRQLMEKVGTWRMWVLRDREPVKNWTQGLFTLIGDAAHPTLQYLGQGAAMSIEDGVCLADELERSSGDFNAAALKYQQRRYLRTARLQMISRLYGEVYHANGPVRELRNNLLPQMIKSGDYESLAWMYDYEP